MSKAVASSFYSSLKGQTVPTDLDRTRPFFMVVLSVLLTLTILGAIFYIGLRVKVVNLGYRINQEIQSKERVIEENKRLSLEIARLKSPTRIEMEAKKLGLQLPVPHQVFYLGVNSAALDTALAKIKPLPVSPKEPEASVAGQSKAKTTTVAGQSKAKTTTVAAQKLPGPKESIAKAKEKTPAPPMESIAKAAEKAPATPKENIAKAAPEKALPKPEKKEPTLPAVKEKAAAPLLIAKIVPPRDEKTLSTKKSSESKPRQARIREGIPAAMLDTMP